MKLIETRQTLLRCLGTCITSNVSGLGMPLGAATPKPLYPAAAAELPEAVCFAHAAAVKPGHSAFHVMNLEHENSSSSVQKQLRSPAAPGTSLLEAGGVRDSHGGAALVLPLRAALGPALPHAAHTSLPALLEPRAQSVGPG